MELEKIREIIAEKLDIDGDRINPETTFEELRIDSLDMVEIVMDLEDTFDITIEPDEEMTTVGDLVGYIKDKI